MAIERKLQDRISIVLFDRIENGHNPHSAEQVAKAHKVTLLPMGNHVLMVIDLSTQENPRSEMFLIKRRSLPTNLHEEIEKHGFDLIAEVKCEWILEHDVFDMKFDPSRFAAEDGRTSYILLNREKLTSKLGGPLPPGW